MNRYLFQWDYKILYLQMHNNKTHKCLVIIIIVLIKYIKYNHLVKYNKKVDLFQIFLWINKINLLIILVKLVQIKDYLISHEIIKKKISK